MILSLFLFGKEALAHQSLDSKTVVQAASPAFKFSSYPLPPPASKLKVAPSNVQIYQHDETPIGNRKPLLMVHGLRGEFREGFRWEVVVRNFLKDPEFSKNFKIYYARYNTYVRLSAVRPHFKKAVIELSQFTGGKPITVMALSMGGNVVQDALEDIATNSCIERVMTLGTPFHGSPLFCFDWLRYSIIKNHDVPWVRGDLCLSYRLYFDRHPNLLEDLRWDNSDNGIPTIGKFSTWFPFHVTGELSTPRMSNPRIVKLNEHLQVDKKKLVCYSGYLLTHYVTPHRSSKIMNAIKWPWWFATCTLPYHLGFEHSVLRALNYEMGRMVVADKSGQKPILLGSDRYGLNDGITPVVSALFLPSQVLADSPIADERDMSTIRKNVDVRKGRVFRQIDHITFVDGYRPRRYSKELKDELAPELGTKTIFNWMLTDLLEKEEQLANTTSSLSSQSVAD
ncbi:MAG: hypothetical protein K2W82_08705 [Candidatus Obscuribacterales bacterium]|nr:hypothetical protein [Candidatus Obscuribacterales bacterium]